MEGWSDFALLVIDRHVKLQFLERLQISGSIHHPFSEGFTCNRVLQKKAYRILSLNGIELHRPILDIGGRAQMPALFQLTPIYSVT